MISLYFYRILLNLSFILRKNEQNKSNAYYVGFVQVVIYIDILGFEETEIIYDWQVIFI